MKPLLALSLLLNLGLAWLLYDHSAKLSIERLNAEKARQQSDEARVRSEQLTRTIQARTEENTRLQNEAREVHRLRQETSRLKADLKAIASAPPPAAPANPGAPATSKPGSDDTGVQRFSKEQFAFSGYASPEAALLSAIASMRDGNFQQYFNSLTPQEQARMNKLWENKTPEEIAEKHRRDTSQINGLKVIDRTQPADDQMLLGVYIEGTSRFEQVSMHRVGEEWRFGGFVRTVTAVPAQALQPAR